MSEIKGETDGREDALLEEDDLANTVTVHSGECKRAFKQRGRPYLYENHRVVADAVPKEAG
jgi:hypothetical protein